MDLWNTLNPIANPAAADRVMFGTGPNAGGYSERGDFMWRDAAGIYTAQPAVNKEVRILAAAHGTFAGLTGGIVFTRTDGGQLQAIFGAENGGLVMAAREGVIFATGGGALYSSTVERARLDASGKFGIGTPNPISKLHSHEASANPNLIWAGNINNGYAIGMMTATEGGLGAHSSHVVAFFGAAGSVPVRMGRFVGAGTASGPVAAPTRLELDTTYANTATPSNQQLKFNLVPASANEGYGWSVDNIGRLWHHAGSSVGPTGAHIFATGNAARWQIITAGHFQPVADNAYAFGGPSNRTTVLYSVTGTINTCDIRLKFYRAEPAPTADEHAAVLECFDAFGFFQHLDAIAREADGGAPARWHFGPKAQEVWSIFASHGLAAALVEDASGDLVPPSGSVPPAFLCFDEWGEETDDVMAWWRPSDILGPDGQPVMVPCAEGEEGTEQRPTGETCVVREAGNIFGIRIDQLQSLMLVALNKERLEQAATIAALDARVAALEVAA